jgi:hypothetical protein
MSGIISMKVGRALVLALRNKWAEFDSHKVLARVKDAVGRAQAAGFELFGDVVVSNSLPYLIVLVQCKASYSDYVLPLELRVWQDGVVHLIIQNEDKDLFTVRILANDSAHQAMHIEELIFKERKKKKGA